MVNFHGNFDEFFTVTFFYNFYNSRIVPRRKLILEVNEVSCFEVEPPLKIFGFWLEWGNLWGCIFEKDFFVRAIVEVSDSELIVINFDDLAPRPANFVSKIGRFDNINKIANFQALPKIIFELEVKARLG